MAPLLLILQEEPCHSYRGQAQVHLLLQALLPLLLPLLVRLEVHGDGGALVVTQAGVRVVVGDQLGLEHGQGRDCGRGGADGHLFGGSGAEAAGLGRVAERGAWDRRCVCQAAGGGGADGVGGACGGAGGGGGAGGACVPAAGDVVSAAPSLPSLSARLGFPSPAAAAQLRFNLLRIPRNITFPFTASLPRLLPLGVCVIRHKVSQRARHLH